MEISDFDKSRIQEILLGEGDSFSRQLLRLIAKADGPNRETLRSVYPSHVEAYENWYWSDKDDGKD